MFFGLGRLSCPGGSSVVVLVVAVGLGVVEPAGWAPPAVRPTVTAVGFAAPVAPAAGVPVAVVLETVVVGTDVGEAASLHTSSRA